jgi:protocatechuate 3,4-dioxygenase beta subunit
MVPMSQDDDIQVGRILSRREALTLLGAATALFLPGCGSGDSGNGGQASPTTGAGSSGTTGAPAGATQAAPGTTSVASPSCVVKPALTEGPYFVDEKLNRSDIRSDPSDGSVAEGVPLRLGFRVARVTAGGCAALSGANVDIWHCDAAGRYSDVSANRTVGRKFLRGYQTTDANGSATFTTIYPGWYMGRAVHIHVKIRTQQGQEFTSQLFFDEAVNDQVYAQAPYNGRGQRVRNEQDSIYRSAGSQLLLAVNRDGQGYATTFDIGLQS